MNVCPQKNIDRFAYIKGLMAMRNIKSVQIAHHLGVTPSAVSLVISGKQRSRRVQQAIADFLNMPYDEVWGKAA